MRETLTVRITDECKQFIYDEAKKYGNPTGKIIVDMVRAIQDGTIKYDGEKFATDNYVPKNFSENKKDLDLTKLYKAAEKRRVTPESFLNMLLKPFAV